MDLETTFNEIDINKIDEYIANKQEENLHLDFKLVNTPNLNRDDRKTYAKCVSGFANSGGGIIVWGIDARKGNDDIDCATSKNPIPNLSLFLSKITSLTGEVIDPIVDGVIHKKIIESNDSGYAASLIPMSYSGPHMAKGGDDRYYKRSGDSFYRMEHFDLEDMFGRRKKPVLTLDHKISFTHQSKNDHFITCTLMILLSISNSGRGSAKAPYLSIKYNDPFSVYRYGIDGNGSLGLPQLAKARGSDHISYGSSSDFVIHPSTSLDITSLATKVTISESGISIKNDLEIDYLLGSEDITLIEDRLIITKDEIEKSLPRFT